MVLMQYISVFFSGFVLSEFQPALITYSLLAFAHVWTLVKLPFPLTLGFKSLLSRDIAMPDLDVRWVSCVLPLLPSRSKGSPRPRSNCNQPTLTLEAHCRGTSSISLASTACSSSS
jgi:hypothetical protein